MEGPVQELYDVVVLSGIVRADALGPTSDEVRCNVWLEGGETSIRWTARKKKAKRAS
jgi:hypothetical protein